MRAEPALWLLAAALSGLLAHRAWTLAAPSEGRDPPPPLPRGATPAERAQVAEQIDWLREQLAAAHERHGTHPPVEALEGHAPDGTPWLSGPLPDNPLGSQPSSVWPGCAESPPPPEPTPDWLYCPSTGEVRSGPPVD